MSTRKAGLGWIRDHIGMSLPLRVVLLALVLLAALPISGMLGVKPLFVATSIVLWAIVASGLNITVGYVGQLNLSIGAFFAIGAYIGAIGSGRWEWNGLAITAVAVLVAVLVSGVISFFVFRAKGLYFALLTAGIAVLADSVLIVWTDVTGGSQGISTAGGGLLPPPLTLGPIKIATPEQYFILCVWVLALLVFALSALSRTKIVFNWQSVRDDEVLAASVGVKVKRAKRSAFILTSAVAAVAGVIFAHWMGYIAPDSFTFSHASVMPLAMVIIGGSGTLLGPIIGAAIVVGLPEVFSELHDYSILIFGVLLLLAVLAAPKGIAGLAKDAVRRLSRKKAPVSEKPKTGVPS